MGFFDGVVMWGEFGFGFFVEIVFMMGWFVVLVIDVGGQV